MPDSLPACRRLVVCSCLSALALTACGTPKASDASDAASDTFEAIPGGLFSVDLARSKRLSDSTWLVAGRVQLPGAPVGPENEMQFSADCVAETVAIVNGAGSDTARARAALPSSAPAQPFASYGDGVWQSVCARLAARHPK